MTDPLRYPIGTFTHHDPITEDTIEGWIAEIERLPADVTRAVEWLSPAQLETPYRPGGWTVRQVVYHLGDSHLNSYVRFKWALTEPRPTIKPYDEARWAELADCANAPVSESLDFLATLHRRWAVLLRGLTAEDVTREFVHPESGPMTLGAAVGLYAWHGRHHLAHVTALAEREGWG